MRIILSILLLINVPAFGASVATSTIATLAELQTRVPILNEVVNVQGHTTRGDWGGSKQYVWDSTNILAASDIRVQTSATATGRYVHYWDGDLGAFGALGDGVTDNTIAFSNAIAEASVNGIAINIPAGVFKITAPIIATNTLYLSGVGSDSILDFSSMSAIDTAAIIAMGSMETLPIPVSGLHVGSSNIVFASDPGLETGDVVILSSTNLWSTARVSYNQGEMLRVSLGAGANVSFFSSLLDAYDPALGLSAYKMVPIKANIRDLSIRFPGDGVMTSSISGIRLTLSDGFNLENLRLYGMRYTQIRIDRCYDGLLRGITAWETNANVGLNYGIQIGNSQRLRISDSHLSARRHGLTLGGQADPGNVVNREIIIANNVIQSLGDALGADNHGNSEYISFVGNVMPGGIAIGGDHATVIGNRIGNANFLGYAVAVGETVGADFVFSGNAISAFRKPLSALAAISITASTVRTNQTFVFKNNTVDVGTNISDTFGTDVNMGFSISATASATNLVNVDVSGNTFSYSPPSTGLLYAVYIASTSAAGFKDVAIKNNVVNGAGIIAFNNLSSLDVSGNHVNQAPLRGIAVVDAGGYDFPTRVITVRRNTVIDSGLTGIDVNGSTDNATAIAVANNDVWNPFRVGILSTSKDGYGYAVSQAGTLLFHDNSLSDTGNPQQTVGSAFIRTTDIMRDGDNFQIGLGTNLLESVFATNRLGLQRQGTIVASYGSSAPTSGTWRTGDRILNTLPTATNPIDGWICTASGTPGTWQQYGPVSVAGSLWRWDSTNTWLVLGDVGTLGTTNIPLTIRKDLPNLRVALRSVDDSTNSTVGYTVQAGSTTNQVSGSFAAFGHNEWHPLAAGRVNLIANSDAIGLGLSAAATNDTIYFVMGSILQARLSGSPISPATPLGLLYDGTVSNVGVTNINGAAVLYFIGVVP